MNLHSFYSQFFLEDTLSNACLPKAGTSKVNGL